MQKSNGNGNGKNGDARRAAIEAAVSVLVHLVQDAEAVDHFRVLIAVDDADCRLEITKLSKRKLT